MRAAIITLIVVVGIGAVLAAMSLVTAWPLTPQSVKLPYEIAFFIVAAGCFGLAWAVWHRGNAPTPN
jgi:hypothetical protein